MPIRPLSTSDPTGIVPLLEALGKTKLDPFLSSIFGTRRTAVDPRGKTLEEMRAEDPHGTLTGPLESSTQLRHARPLLGHGPTTEDLYTLMAPKSLEDQLFGLVTPLGMAVKNPERLKALISAADRFKKARTIAPEGLPGLVNQEAKIAKDFTGKMNKLDDIRTSDMFPDELGPVGARMIEERISGRIGQRKSLMPSSSGAGLSPDVFDPAFERTQQQLIQKTMDQPLTGFSMSPDEPFAWETDNGIEIFYGPGPGEPPLAIGMVEDALTMALRTAREEGRRWPTADEMETWLEIVMGNEGKKLGTSARAFIKGWEIEDLYDITKRAILADPEGRRWYRFFNEDLVPIVGKANIPEFSVVFSLTSPQNSAENNLRDAIYIMSSVRKYMAAGGSPHNREVFRKYISDRLRNIPTVTTDKEAGGLTTTELGTIANSKQRLDKIVEFYVDGVFSGDMKTKSFMLNVAQSESIFSTNDIRVANFIGVKQLDKEGNVVLNKKGEEQLRGLDVSGGMSEPYRIVQWLETIIAEDLSKELGEQIIPKQIQATWWRLDKLSSSRGDELKKLGLRGDWPHDPGSIESAMLRSKLAIEEFVSLGLDPNVAFVDEASKLTTRTRPGQPPVSRPVVETLTQAQQKRIGHLPREGVLRQMGSPAESEGILRDLARSVKEKRGIVR